MLPQGCLPLGPEPKEPLWALGSLASVCSNLVVLPMATAEQFLCPDMLASTWDLLVPGMNLFSAFVALAVWMGF